MRYTVSACSSFVRATERSVVIWRTWNDVVRERLLPVFRNDGALEGKSPEDAIVRSCLAQLTLEVYYRYTCVFRPH